MPLFRADTPLGVRAIVPTVGLLSASWAALYSPKVIDSIAGRVAITYAIVLAGFLTLGVLRTVATPHLPLRITISVSIIAQVAILVIAPVPPIAVVVAIALSLTAIGTHISKPRTAFNCLVALAALMCIMTVAFFAIASLRDVATKDAQFWLGFNAFWIVGSLAALWHGRYLKIAALPSKPDAA